MYKFRREVPPDDPMPWRGLKDKALDWKVTRIERYLFLFLDVDDIHRATSGKTTPSERKREDMCYCLSGDLLFTFMRPPLRTHRATQQHGPTTVNRPVSATITAPTDLKKSVTWSSWERCGALMLGPVSLERETDGGAFWTWDTCWDWRKSWMLWNC